MSTFVIFLERNPELSRQPYFRPTEIERPTPLNNTLTRARNGDKIRPHYVFKSCSTRARSLRQIPKGAKGKASKIRSLILHV